MRKLLNNPKFVAAMVVLAIALGLLSLKKPDYPAAPPPDQGEAAEDQPLPGGTKAETTPEEALKRLPIAKISRDPFAGHNTQSAATATETPDLPDLLDSARLTGVFTQNGKTLLLLNDHILQVGDKIGRLTIESANQEGIWLSHWKGRDFLPVGKSFVLKTPARRASTP